MALIQSTGLGTQALGADTVKKIIDAEKEDAEKRINQSSGLVKAQITAYGELKSRMSKFQDVINKLADPKVAGALTASSSDESLLAVQASESASAGNYSLQINNTAKAHSIASKRFSSEYSVVGEGKLTFSFGTNQYDGSGNLTGQSSNANRPNKTITIDSSNRTLTGIRNAINNAKMGVTARVVNDGSGFRLSISSNETGESNGMQIFAQDNTGNPLTSGLGVLNFNSNQQGTGFAQQTSKGEDARLEINGLQVSRSTNTIDDVIDGVTLNIKNADASKQLTVSLKPDTEALKKHLREFVETYNNMKEVLDDVTQFNPNNQKAGLLIGDSLVRGIESRIKSMISTPIQGLEGQTYNTLASLGIGTDRTNDFKMMFSSTVFNKAMATASKNVSKLLSVSGRTTDSQIRYMNTSIKTKPGTYDVEITKLATKASLTTNSVAGLNFASPVAINDSNDNFSINVDGKNVAVSLRHGNYNTGNELAEHLTQQINGALGSKHISVAVNYNAADSNFTFTSNAYGSKSEIAFSSLDSETANTLGFNTLGQGAYIGRGMNVLGQEAMSGKGAMTQIGNKALSATSGGLDFSANNATFALKVDGQPAVNVSVNQNAAGQDLNADGVFGDRKDTLQAIQNAIDSTSLNGKVKASFNTNGYLVFNTVAVGSARSIEISAVGTNTNDRLLGLQSNQGVQSNGVNAGINLSSAAEFKVKVDGTTSTTAVSIPAGTYATGQALASAIQTQLAAKLSSDPAFANKIKGASTDTGSRNISNTIDFSTNRSGFVVNVNGVEKEIVVNSGSTNNITSIQAQLDSEFGPNIVTASLDGNGLKLTTNTTGHDKFIEVKSDGRGARTSAGADMSTGIDFSGANNATFTLSIGNKDINVNVTENASAGGAQANLVAVQNAINTALDAHADFAPGDVVARLDANNKIYIQTRAEKGIRTASSFGKNAQIQVKNLGGTAASNLGLVAETKANGYEGFGLNKNRKYGYDLTPEVTYKANTQDKTGRFEIKVGGSTTNVRFDGLNSSALQVLGLQNSADYAPKPAKGQDAQGTINGKEASGEGQYLRAVDGNVKAKNGYYIAGKAHDFSQGSGITITNGNNKFKINVDGVEEQITLNVGDTFTTGKQFARAIEVAINTRSGFSSRGIAVKVEFTNDPQAYAHQKLSIVSGSVGSKSVVEITEISAGASNITGFIKGIADGAQGTDRVGDVEESSGLRIQVLGGALGKRGSVTYVSGFADQVKDMMKNFLDRKGSIALREEALQKQSAELVKSKKELDERMEKKAENLRSKFLYNDKIVSKLNTTLDYLKQQFAAMNNSKK